MKPLSQSSKWGFTGFWALFTFMAHWVSMVTAQDAPTGDWTRVPGDLQVLSGTDAHFDWRHNISGYVDITWYYIGTNAFPVLDSIMFYSKYQVHIPKLGDRQQRLRFSNFTGSANMILRDVTIADAGNYKAQVTDPKLDVPGGFYIDNAASLKVIEKSVLYYRIEIKNESAAIFGCPENIELSVEENGTMSDLSAVCDDRRILVPSVTRVGVNVVVNDRAPKPVIYINNHVGVHKFPQVCEGFECKTILWFSSDFNTNKALVNITIDFRVQNLDVVVALLPVTIETKEDPAERTVLTSTQEDGPVVASVPFFIGVVAGVLFLVLFLIVFVRLWQKYEKTQDQADGKNKFVPPFDKDVGLKDLNRRVVPPSELTEPEYAFKFNINSSEPFSFSDKSARTIAKIVACMTALLNTCRGVIYLESSKDRNTNNSNNNSSREMTAWVRDLLRYAAQNHITDDILDKCVEIDLRESSISIVVKKSPKLVTFKYHTYWRDHSGLRTVKNIDTMERILCQTTISEENRKMVKMPSRLDQNGKRVHVLGKTKKGLSTKINKLFISLANTEGGGCIILEEDFLSGLSHINSSFENEDDENVPLRNLQTHVDYIQDLKELFSAPLLWGNKGQQNPRIPRHQEDWSLTRDEENSCYVLQVFQSCGGVFVKAPECFTLADNGEVIEVSFEDWLTKMFNEDEKNVRMEDAGGESYEHDEQRKEMMKDAEREPHEQSKAMPSTTLVLRLEDEEAISESPTVEDQELRWSSTQKYKTFVTKQENIILVPNDFKSPIFKLTKPFMCTPDLSILENLYNFPNARNIVEKIQKIHPDDAGWIFVCRNVLETFQNTSNITIPSSLIADFIVCVENRGLILVSYCMKSDEDTKEYGLLAAIVFMKHITESMKDPLNVVPISVCTFCPNEERIQMDKTVGTATRLNNACLIAAMTKVLMTKRTYISNVLTEDLLHSYSSDQDQVFRAVSNNLYVCVDGPSGSGKTWIAEKVCADFASKYKKENILFITPSKSHFEHVKARNLCSTKQIQQMSDQIGTFATEWKLVVIDGAQNLPLGIQKAWSAQFPRIRTSRLIVCMDSRLHSTETKNLAVEFVKSAVNNNKTFAMCTLSANHRSTRRVASFLEQCCDENLDAKTDKVESKNLLNVKEQELEYKYGDMGDDVYLHLLRQKEKTPIVERLVQYLIGLVSKLLEENKSLESVMLYEPRDITILVDDHFHLVPEMMPENLLEHFDIFKDQRTNALPRNGLKVCSLSDFAGLESRVVIFVFRYQHEERYAQNRHIKDGCYKRLIASRGIHRVDFVYYGKECDSVKRWLGFDDDTESDVSTRGSGSDVTSKLVIPGQQKSGERRLLKNERDLSRPGPSHSPVQSKMASRSSGIDFQPHAKPQSLVGQGAATGVKI